jgi:hypothetical protein
VDRAPEAHRDFRTEKSSTAMNPAIINITSAEQVGGYCLRLQFDDASEQVVDFGPFLRDAQHPDIRAFLDQEKFLTYRLEEGNLIWGDYDLCFPVTDLHANTLWSPARRAAA